MAFIAVAQVFGAVGTALGTIAVLFYIRAAIGDGTLGRLNIEIESAAEPGTAVLFLTSIIAVILAASFSIWISERAITDLAVQQASRLRQMILKLIDDPLSENWQERAGFRRAEVEVQQVFVSRIRSLTVALTDVLSLAPAFAVLTFAASVAVIIDPLAALILLPFIVVFAVISERLNRRIQSLTATFEGRQERTRLAMAEQLNDLFNKRRTHEQVSMTRVSTDDHLFHDRQLESTKLRLLGVVNGAFLFALTAAFFIIFRGVESLAIERIIAYIFAIRFAARSGEQILKAMAQVSRRYEDIQSVSHLIATIDEVRVQNAQRKEHKELPDELIVSSNGSELTIVKGKPVVVLSKRPVTDHHAESLLRVIAGASGHPDLDLSSNLRITTEGDTAPRYDILADPSVRVIISDSPVGIDSIKGTEFTFLMHNRPKVLLSAETRSAAENLGPALVIQDGKITWAGSITAAEKADEHIRTLLQAGKSQRDSNSTRRTRNQYKR